MYLRETALADDARCARVFGRPLREINSVKCAIIRSDLDEMHNFVFFKRILRQL